ncbi:uncharacterized protein LOC134693378 [Mytilus trossulus]|uniref:uncharacterized protein LOC134693378 n=1 Tax=Mytilus trossulus TaxID=6551 RepID=UPI003004CC40
MVINNIFKIFHFPACIFFFMWKVGFCQVNLPTFNYEDCQLMGASYTYKNYVICNWIDFSPQQHSTGHCGMFDYAWVPDSGADHILHQLALQRGSSSGAIYHIGYTLNYTTPTQYTVIDVNGKPQSYSAFSDAMDPNNTCVAFIDGHWDDIPCTLYREAFCSLVIKFDYGDCRENGVSYTSGLKLYCYWIDTTLGTAVGACGLDYSIIPNLEAQRVVNWLMKIRSLTTLGTYYIGYVENTGGVETHQGVTQDWTNWDPLETQLIITNCITISQPYGLWKHSLCSSLRMSICSTVTEIIPCQTPIVNSGSTLISQTGDMYGDTCHYTCDMGHALVYGNLTRTCLIDGTWDSSSPVCEEILTSQATTDIVSTANTISTAESTTAKPSIAQTSTAGSISNDMLTSTVHQQVSTATNMVISTTSNHDIPETTLTETITYNQEITETTTGVISRTTNGLCICTCSLSLNITINIEQRIKELKKLLEVDKDVLSSTIRRLTCADDPRPSSAYIGYTGALIIVAVFSLIIIIDIVNIYVFFKTLRT